MIRYAAPAVGTICERQARPPRKGAEPVPPKPPHQIQHPDDDADLQRVLFWLRTQPGAEEHLIRAVTDAIDYVLEARRTGRFDLDDPDVDSDERASVGTKVQYRILDELGLPKVKPLDTVIDGVPVDIKNTVGTDWMIPMEGQCELCLLIQIRNADDELSVWLMRTHEKMLRPGKNQDSKRSITSASRAAYAVPVFTGLQLPRDPLRDLTPEQRDVVFDPRRGFRHRAISLFSFMPRVVIPRRSLVIVGGDIRDPMRRVRESKPMLREEHGLELLGGRFERAAAGRLGYPLGLEDWVAVPLEDVPGDLRADVMMSPGISVEIDRPPAALTPESRIPPSQLPEN